MRPRLLTACLFTLGLCVFTSRSVSQVIAYTWTGNSTNNGLISDGQNWGGTAPTGIGGAENLIFGASGPQTNVLVTTGSYASLHFDTTRPAYTFSGSGVAPVLTISAANGVTVTAGSTVTFNSSLGLNLAAGVLTGDDHNFNIAAATTLQINGVISGTGHFTKTGAGTLVLTGANTFNYNGGLGFLNSTSIRAGTVTLNGGAINHGSSGDIWIGELNGDNGTLNIASGGTASGYFGVLGSALGSTGTATIDGGTSSWTVSNGMSVGSSGTGSLTLSNGGKVNIVGGAGTLNVGANSGSTGTLNIGAASGNSAAAGGIVNAAAITTANGASGTVQFNTTGTSATPYYFTKDGTSGGTAVAINGAGAVVNTNGYTVLGGASTYTGTTTINGGTLAVSSLANGGNSSSIGASSSAAANLVINGGTLRYTGGNTTTDRLFTLGIAGGTIDISNPTVAGSFTFANTGNVALAGTNTARTLSLGGTPGYSSTVYFNSVLGDNGTGATSVVALDGSFWRLAAANTYSGGTTVNSGGLLVAINTAGSATGSGPVTVSSGGRLSIGSNSPDGAISGNIAVNGTGTVEFNRSTAYTYAGVISGTGSVFHTGTAGAITLTGTNTYTGGTTVNGTLRIGSGGTTGSIVGNVTNNGTLIFDRSDASTFSGNISGTGSIFKQGAGSITLTGSSTYTGGTTITAGNLFVSGSVAHGAVDTIVNGSGGSAPVFVVYNGGDMTTNRLRLGITDNTFFGDAIVSGSGSTLTANNYLYVGEAGTGDLSIQGGGAVTSPNTSVGNNIGGSGSVVVNGAGSTLSNSDTLYVGAEGVGTMAITDGAVVSNATGSIGHNTGGGGGTVYLDSGGAWNTSGTLFVGNSVAGFLDVYSAGTVTASNVRIGQLSGSSGTVTLIDAGSTLTTTGNLVIGASGNGSLAVGNGADVVTGGSSAVLGDTVGGTGYVTLDGAGTSWTVANTLYIGNNGIGEAYLSKQALLSVGAGSGTVILGTNPGSTGLLYFGFYNGEGGDDAGILNAASITTSGGTGIVYFESFNSNKASPFYLTKDGTVGGAAVTIAGPTQVENTFGYTVLSGANTYTGGTKIYGGTLVAGSNSALGTGSVTINGGSLIVANGVTFGNALSFGLAGGSLGGSGSFSSPLTLGSGVTIAPGSSPGTMTFAGGLTLNDGGILEIEIRAPSGTPGTDWDFLSITGTLDLTPLSTGGYTLKAISLDLANNPGQPVSGLTGPTSWTIATASSGITGFATTDFLFDVSQFYGGGDFSLSVSGNNLVLNFTPVPEPSTYALLASGLAIAGLRWRRRRSGR